MNRQRITRLVGALVVAPLMACEASPNLRGDILAIGDSLLDYHTPDADIATVAGDALNMEVDLEAIGGSTMLGDDSISETYVDGGHRLLIASGGGNDLGGCVCAQTCGDVMNALISPDGTGGAIPDMIYRALDDGKYVAWVGYLRPMPDAEEFAECGGELDIMRTRLQALDTLEDHMIFVDGAAFGTGLEQALYEADGYHPSAEGSVLVGAEVARRAQEAFSL